VERVYGYCAYQNWATNSQLHVSLCVLQTVAGGLASHVCGHNKPVIHIQKYVLHKYCIWQ